jgi:uracil-DNA glycosylase
MVERISAIDWSTLNRQVKSCGKCAGLNDEAHGTQNAPGYGNTRSPVVIIGQSLCGKPCIEAQTPFTGGSGLLLDEAFSVAGIDKSEIYITNVVKCHPPGNRPSFDHEIDNCSSYLLTELDWIDPTDVICLGKDAWRFFSNDVDRPCSRQISRRTVHFLYHPSYIRRKPADQRADYLEDLASIILNAI